MKFPLSFARFSVVWLTLAVVMTLNGIGRELLLKRFLAVRSADVSSAALGIFFIAVVTAVGFRPLTNPDVSTRERAAVSVALVLLTVVFETLLGRLVDHKSYGEILEHYAIWHGNLWPIVLAWLAFTPFVR